MFDPNTWEAEVGKFCEFEASLGTLVRDTNPEQATVKSQLEKAEDGERGPREGKETQGFK